MINPQTKVVKSKSSNSAITTKSERKNIKTRSNAEFQPNTLKKRGVYVEKKSTIGINIRGPNPLSKYPKLPSRLRPGKKRFVASVLAILSKTTTGTQHPDNGVSNPNKNDRLQHQTKKKAKNPKTTEAQTMDDVNVQKKKKYKSRVLNGKTDEQVVVLQSMKEMFNTPSLYSEGSQDEGFKLSDLPKLVKDEEKSKNDLEKSIHTSIPIVGIAKEVWEGKKAKRDKHVKIDNDPVTMVSDLPKKDEKGLYNFFVDLLETTFSVYNVKAQYNAAPDISTDISNSRIALEIDESVVKKLNVYESKELPEMYDDVTQKPSKQYYYIKSDVAQEWDDQKLIEHFQSKPKSLKHLIPDLKTQKKRNLRTQFNYVKKTAAKTHSAISIEKKSFSRNNKKKNLLGLLKEQLKMDFDRYEEPQNLYQALRVIARTKRKCQKSIRFQTEDYNNKCMFKRRKLISASTKNCLKKNHKPVTELLRSIRATTNSEMSNSRNKYLISPKTDTPDYENESRHSLEVYGLDYEVEPARKNADMQNKELVFTYHSSQSVSDRFSNPSEAILTSTDSSTTVRKFRRRRE